MGLTIIDTVHIGLTLFSCEGGFKSLCHLVNSNVCTIIQDCCVGSHSDMSSIFYTMCSIMANPPLNELLKNSIHCVLSAYLRTRLVSKFCVVCSREIQIDKPAVILNCGKGAHESCLKIEPTKNCHSCKKLSEDVWWSLIPLER